jgi:hypothetical protein
MSDQIDTATDDLCFSRSGDDFTHRTLGELFDEMSADGDLVAGTIYYEATCHVMEPKDIVTRIDAVLEEFDEALYEQVGDIAQNDFTGTSDEAKLELKGLITNWISRHVNVSNYWVIPGTPRERTVTQEDVNEYGAGDQP